MAAARAAGVARTCGRRLVRAPAEHPRPARLVCRFRAPRRYLPHGALESGPPPYRREFRGERSGGSLLPGGEPTWHPGDERTRIHVPPAATDLWPAVL